jgi:hypothetical protein
MATLFITRISEKDFLGMREDWNLLLESSVTNEIIKNSFGLNIGNANDFLVDSNLESECPHLIVEKTYEDYLKSFPRKKR